MSLFDATLTTGLRWARIGDAYEVTRKPRDFRLTSYEAIPFASMHSIPRGGTYRPDYTLRSPNEIKSGTYFELGDVLVAKITPSFENGKQALAVDLPTRFGYATTEVIPLRPRVDGHDPRLLFFYLLHPDVRHHIAERMDGSTGRQRVPVDVLLDVPYPVFPSVAQTAIADCLEMVQRMIIVEQELVHAVGRLKLAATRALFTYGLRGQPQKDTEVGPIPDDWRVVRLGAIRNRLQYGTSARCSYKASAFPVLRIPNIQVQRLELSDLKYCVLSDSEASKFQLDPGDMLLVRTNGVIDRLGSCAVYTGEPASALFASYLIRASFKADRADPRFVACFLGTEAGRSTIAKRATSASDGKFNLNTAAVDSLPLPMPTIEEQIDIVLITGAIERSIELHRKRKEVLTRLLAALSHGFMTSALDVSRLTGNPSQQGVNRNRKDYYA